MRQSLSVALIFCIFLIPRVATAQTLGDQFTHFMGFTLENGTTLKKVESIIGPARLTETGDAGEYEVSICYKTNSAYIQFLSGEMGGPEHELIGFSLSLKSLDKNCASLKKKWFSQIPNIGGLYLGMSKVDYLNIVKEKSGSTRIPLSAFFEYTRPMTEEEKRKSLYRKVAKIILM